MSIPQQIHWIQLKHLLLRLCTTCHYQILCATLLVPYIRATVLLVSESLNEMSAILYCMVAYIAACVDVSWNGTFWDRSTPNYSVTVTLMGVTFDFLTGNENELHTHFCWST